MRKIVLTLLSVFFLFTVIQAEDWSKIFKRTVDRHIIPVRVTGLNDEGTSISGNCTGIVVRHNQLLTAAHCVISEHRTATVKDKPIEILKSDLNLDLALLNVNTKGKRPIQVSFTVPDNGKPVAGIGYGLSFADASITPTYVMGYDKGWIRTPTMFLFGYSGGPLITFDGLLVGVMLSTDPNHNLGFAAGIPAVKAFLGMDVYGRDYQDPETEREEGLWRLLPHHDHQP